jgi:hypothetical protein
MTADADHFNEERKTRLNALLAQEKREAELEEKLRSKSRGMGSFLGMEQKRVFGGLEGGLGEHMRRSKANLVSVE